MTGELMNLRHVPVGFGVDGTQSGRLFEIKEGFGVPAGGLTFLRECESGGGEQGRRCRILRIQLVRATKNLISRKLPAEFKQRGSIERVNLKQIWPSIDRAGQGSARL